MKTTRLNQELHDVSNKLDAYILVIFIPLITLIFLLKTMNTRQGGEKVLAPSCHDHYGAGEYAVLV